MTELEQPIGMHNTADGQPAPSAGSEAHSDQPTASEPNQSGQKTSPSPEPTSKHTLKDQEASATHQVVDVESIHSQETNIINKQNNISEIKNIFIGDRKFSARPVAFTLANPITLDASKKYAEDFICDEPLLVTLINQLNKDHFLVLEGDVQSGKYELAVKIAHTVRNPSSASPMDVQVIPPLDYHANINLWGLLEEKSQLNGKITIFKDALAWSNRDLNDFLKTLEESRISTLASKLKRSNAYLILTVDSHSMDRFAPGIKLPPVFRKMHKPSVAILQQALKKTLMESEFEAKVDALTCEEIIKHAKSTLEIQIFVHEYIHLILNKTIDVGEAFSRIGKVQQWLLHHVSEEFEPWLSAVTLALCHSPLSASGVSWIEFENFKSALKPAIIAKVGQPDDNRFEKDRVSDEWLLRRIHARVERDPLTRKDVLQFTDDGHGNAIWDTLLCHCRSLLVSISPTLRSLLSGSDSSLRVLASRALGRIGIIDPQFIIYPLLSECVAGNWQDRATLGYVYQGVYSSRDTEYRRILLSHLSDMAKSDQSHEIWTAIAIYKQLGQIDLLECMSGLRNIAEKYLVAEIEDMQKLAKDIQKLKNQAQFLSVNNQEKIYFSNVASMLKNLISELFSNQLPLLTAFQYALISLCIDTNINKVLEMLERWIKRSEGLGALISLLYLQKDGIAEELDSHQIRFALETCPESSNSFVEISPIVLSLAYESEHSQKNLAGFLENIFCSFNAFFPSDIRKYLSASYIDHLGLLIKGSLLVPCARSAMLSVTYRLLNSKNTDLVTACHKFLSAPDKYGRSELNVRFFADEVLKMGLLNLRPS